MIKYESESMFLLPITEIELENIIRSSRGKPSARFDEIQ